jgi:hypothetical protein
MLGRASGRLRPTLARSGASDALIPPYSSF